MMQYRRLGNSGTVVTQYCLGTMTFGAEADEATSHAMLDDYFAAGGNFIDTADVYSDGASETIIGKWLKARQSEAAQAVVTTKGRLPIGNGPNDLGLSRRYLSRALDASLKRLTLDRVDLYQVHSWDQLTPVEETLRFLDDSVRAGKIAYYGFSNYLGWQISKSFYLAKATGFTLPVSLQPQYNLLVRDIELEVVPACIDAGIGLLPWSPLGGGWLTGKYRRDVRPSGSTRLGENPDSRNEAYASRNANDRTWAILDTVADIARSREVTAAQIALAWVAQQPAVTSVILGARTRVQLADNLAAADVTLNADELARLDAVTAIQMGEYPYGTVGIRQRFRRFEGGW
jgi:aryl-alcohol dehydrogenase-like predicted oxidoreductase